jgi:putative inorganic carbon (hco3(-)) transporter
MRDLIITAIVLGSIPFALKRPWIGLLVWAWLGYMNPHRLAWGFAYNLPFVQIIAAATFAGMFFSKETKRLPVSPVTMLWLAWVAWMTLTTILAMNQPDAWPEWERMLKIQVMILVTFMLITDKVRIDLLVWTIVVSIGFFGTKGGIFVLATGGSYMVWGPPGSFIEGNNELALALLTIVPLMYYLFGQATNKWVKRGLLVSMALCLFSIVGSYSRGALLGGAVMLAVFWLRSKSKIKFGVPLLLVAAAAAAFMPEQWFDRMGTIKTYDADTSAMGRINSWWFAFNVAKFHPIVGGGYNVFWSTPIYQQFAPNPFDQHDAHSIYFEVMGEQGFVGLAIFLTLCVATLLTAQSVIRVARQRADLAWAASLAAMLQVSFCGFAAGGAFLGLAYFDLPYHLMSMVVVLRVLVMKPATETAVAAAPDTPVISTTDHPNPYANRERLT